MYLNDFRPKEIFEILEIIKSKNIKDLLFKVEVIKSDNKLMKMSYCPLLHRLDVDYFDPQKTPLYPNPSCGVKLLPKDMFINNLTPNSGFYTIINS